ncbi:hypothetical protein VYU27_003549 [Nannochloropsis oceanica]
MATALQHFRGSPLPGGGTFVTARQCQHKRVGPKRAAFPWGCTVFLLPVLLYLDLPCCIIPITSSSVIAAATAAAAAAAAAA